MKCMCLQAMSIVYGRYYEDIGMFSDTKYIIGMLERVCSIFREILNSNSHHYLYSVQIKWSATDWYYL